MDILKESRSIQDKVLVFTRSIPTLGISFNCVKMKTRFATASQSCTYLSISTRNLDYLEYITEEAGFRSLKLDGKTPMMVGIRRRAELYTNISLHQEC